MDVLDRSSDTFEKQIEEMSEYNYVFPGLVGVLAVTNKFLEIEQVYRDPVKPLNSGDSSH